MNERIRQLLKQATQTTSHYGFDQTCVDQEKFAQLIVWECAEVAHCNFHVDGLTLGTILKEHFGVE